MSPTADESHGAGRAEHDGPTSDGFLADRALRGASVRSGSGNRGLLGAVVGAGLVLSIPLVLVSPYVRDDVLLDRIVKVVALDWRDFGEARARERLQYELAHQEIGLHVAPENCTFDEVDAWRRVRCAWTLQIPVPGAEMHVPLSFESEARIGPDGDVEP